MRVEVDSTEELRVGEGEGEGGGEGRNGGGLRVEGKGDRDEVMRLGGVQDKSPMNCDGEEEGRGAARGEASVRVKSSLGGAKG